jgi:hypothetical protein
MTFDTLDYRPMLPAAGGFSLLPDVMSRGTFDKVEAFRQLPVGWHYGEGGPVDDAVIVRARDALSFLVLIGLTHTDAFAGAGGEILLTAYHRDHYVGVILEPDGSFALSHEERDREVRDRERLSLAELKSELLDVARGIGIARGIWSSSDTFTLGTLTAYGAGSITSASRTFEARSRWSVANASILPASQSVLMQGGSTPP